MIKDEKLQLHLGVGNYGFNGLLFSLQQPYFNHLLTRNDEVVSVDQLESSIPGFIGQMTGKLTNKRAVASTIFVDHASDLDMFIIRHQCHQRKLSRAN